MIIFGRFWNHFGSKLVSFSDSFGFIVGFQYCHFRISLWSFGNHSGYISGSFGDHSGIIFGIIPASSWRCRKQPSAWIPPNLTVRVFRSITFIKFQTEFEIGSGSSSSIFIADSADSGCKTVVFSQFRSCASCNSSPLTAVDIHSWSYRTEGDC